MGMDLAVLFVLIVELGTRMMGLVAARNVARREERKNVNLL